MVYLVDIGNTRTKIGLGTVDGRIQQVWHFLSKPEALEKSFQEKLPAKKAEVALIASVVPEFTETLTTFFQRMGVSSINVSRAKKWGYSLGVDNKDTVGQDRLLNMEAASESHSSVLVIDLGTVTKFDLLVSGVDKKFVGGAIGPGFTKSFEALLQNTSQLSDVNLNQWPAVIGKDTSNAIRSGFLHGFLAMMEGMHRKFKESEGLDRCETWITGGASHYFEGHLPQGWEHHPNLTLEGMFAYGQRNGLVV